MHGVIEILFCCWLIITNSFENCTARLKVNIKNNNKKVAFCTTILRLSYIILYIYLFKKRCARKGAKGLGHHH